MHKVLKDTPKQFTSPQELQDLPDNTYLHWLGEPFFNKQCKGKYGFTLHIFITFFSPQVKS